MQDDEILAAFASLSEAMAAAKSADDEVGRTRKLNDEAMKKHAQALQLVDVRKQKIATLAAKSTPVTSSVVVDIAKPVAVQRDPKMDLPNPRKK